MACKKGHTPGLKDGVAKSLSIWEDDSLPALCTKLVHSHGLLGIGDRIDAIVDPLEVHWNLGCSHMQ